MEKSNPVKDQSFRFAVDIVLFCGHLKNQKHYELSNQLIRSGTAIGANVEEALEAFTRKDFAYRMSIASREAVETIYWLRIIKEAGLLPETDLNSLIHRATALKLMLVSIVKTTQDSLK